MIKRADGKYKRNTRDFYRTPYEAVVPLLPHTSDIKNYIEPCAGGGILISHLQSYASCVYASDINIEPLSYFPVKQKSALSWKASDWMILNIDNGRKPDAFITNPPWSREILHPMIEVLASLLPTWLLYDSDWAYTVQAIPYMEYCRKIVAVGRVCWFPETKMSGYDNTSWYLFDRLKKSAPYTEFYGRKHK